MKCLRCRIKDTRQQLHSNPSNPSDPADPSDSNPSDPSDPQTDTMQKSKSEYESFVFWRALLPEIDLSELSDLSGGAEPAGSVAGKERKQEVRKREEGVRKQEEEVRGLYVLLLVLFYICY